MRGMPLKEKRRGIGRAGRLRGSATRSAKALEKRDCPTSRGQHAAIYEGLPARQSARACATLRQVGAERGEARRLPRCPPPGRTTGLCLAPTPGLHSGSRLPDPSERPCGQLVHRAQGVWGAGQPPPLHAVESIARAALQAARSRLLGREGLSRQLCQQQTEPEGVWRSPLSQASLP